MYHFLFKLTEILMSRSNPNIEKYNIWRVIAFMLYCIPPVSLLTLFLLDRAILNAKIDFVQERNQPRPVHLIFRIYNTFNSKKDCIRIIKQIQMFKYFLSNEFCFATQVSGALMVNDTVLAKNLLEKEENKIFLKTYWHYNLFFLWEVWDYKQIVIDVLKIIEKQGISQKNSDITAENFLSYIPSINVALAASLANRPDLAAYCFLGYFHQLPPWNDLSKEELHKKYISILKQHLSPIIPASQLAGESGGKIGLFFTDTGVFGHMISDPTQFIRLYAHQYDRIYFLGRDMNQYPAACKIAMQIIGQYGDYIAYDDELLYRISWLFHGTFTIGDVTLHIENYWSLNKDITLNHLDSDVPFKFDAWKIDKLPQDIIKRGYEFAAYQQIDITKPIIILHAREQKYHGAEPQRHRNANINNYQEAITDLIENNYQVIRIGDPQMTKLSFQHPQYFELPFLKGYENSLDPFFIFHSTFMIGCQSGPCAYARSMNVPLLSVNSIWNYSHIPSSLEMGCPKPAFKIIDKMKQYISDAEYIRKDYLLFENVHQFNSEQIVFEECTSEEITAAVQDMIKWLSDDMLPQTFLQLEIQKEIHNSHQRLQKNGKYEPTISSYVGVSLPEYRISPSLLEIRKTKY